MWPRRSQQSVGKDWTSVLFLPARVEIAEVQRRTDAAPRVVDWETVAVATDAEFEALKTVRKRLAGRRCTTLLGYGQYQMVQVEAPQGPAEERRDAVRWRIKEMVDFPVDAAGIDVLDIPAQGARTPQIFAVAASHACLTPRIHAFQDAKLALAAIDIPELAQRNVAALFEDPERGLALLAFDDDGGCLTFTFKGELFASRHIEVTRKALSEATGEALAALHERVLLDVQRSLDNFDRNYNFITLTRVLVAPFPGAAAFVDYLRGNLYQPVEVLDLGKVLDISGVPALAQPEQQGQALLAIGAALRDAS
jgi:MSHA biogenesis protein MshI